MAGIIAIFGINNMKLLSHMDQISEHINSSNHKIQYHDQMSKMVVNLCSKIYKNNETFSWHLTHIQNLLLMIISDTPENNLFNVFRKSDMRKLRTSSVKSLSTLFSCSMCVLYNRVNSD